MGNAGRNITLTFSEAIHKDASGGEFDTSGLEGILTLKAGGPSGTDIDFSAALGTDKTVITIDPDADLAEGAVHVAVSNAYFDQAGNQGTAASATFTLDTSAPAPTFSPAHGGSVKNTGTDITISFGEAIGKDSTGAEFSTTELKAILTLRTDDENGAVIGFSAALDTDKKVITIDPTTPWPRARSTSRSPTATSTGRATGGRHRAPPSASTPPHRRRRPSARPTAPGWATRAATSP